MPNGGSDEREEDRRQLATGARQEAERATGSVLGGGELRHRLRPARVGGAHRRDRRGLVPGAVGRTNRLLEALAVDGDHPRGCLDDRRRASVVRREHHAPRGRVVVPEAQDPPHVGEPPGVDRLVVVADHEEVVLGSGKQPDEAKLRGVHVLELVDADVLESRLPAEAERRIRREQVGGPDHEVVEVDRAARQQQLLVGPQDGLRIGRRRATLHLPGREPRVELRSLRQRDRWIRRGMPAAGGAQEREPIGEDVRPLAGVEEHLARESVEGADLDRRGIRHRWAEALRHPPREVLRCVPVEGHDADPRGLDAPREEHGQARDHRRRLAAAGRGDDLGRTVRQDRGGALLGIQGGQDRAEVDAGRCRDGGLHRSIV